LFYAVVLYGIIGLVLGVVSGMGVAVLGPLLGLRDPGAWTLGFLGVFLTLGGTILVRTVDRVVYLEQGLTGIGLAVVAGVGAVVVLVGIWILPILMTRTPLKVLLQPKGTVTLWLGLVVLAAVFSFAPGGPNPHGKQRPDRTQDPRLRTRPNVLVVLVDSLRADHLGAYASWPADHTPHLDALAAEGVVFEQAYAASSWTRASTASILTSMLPGSHRTLSRSAVLPADVYTVAELLQEQGWVTGGLPNSIDVTRTFNFQQGFDYFRYLAPDDLFGATESASQLAMYAVVRDLRARLLPEGLRVTDYYQPAQVVLEHAMGFIEAQGEDRWFLMVHLMEPHGPYFRQPVDGTGHARGREATDPAEVRALYAAEVAALDVQLGRFLAQLGPARRADTLVVVTADHGEELQDHGADWHGTTLYDEVLHVPLIVRLPQGQHGGVRAPWQVRTLDLAPTLAAQLGFPPSPRWQGVDLFDRSFREGQDRLAREALQLQAVADGVEGAEPPLIREPGIHPEDRPVIAQADFAGNRLSAIRAGGWKYIKAESGGSRDRESEELFHVSADLQERTNLAGGAGVVQARLDQQLSEGLATAAASAASSRDPELDAAASERMRALGTPD
jgi:arylsulfatase A-like enzyme